MRNQPETRHEYNIPRLNWWFLFSMLAFLACLVLMIWVDYSGGQIRWLGLRGDREWKTYQHRFFQVEARRLAADARAAEARANEQGLAKLVAERAQVSQQLEARRGEEQAAAAALDQARVNQFLVTRDFTMRKADRDQARSAYEETLERNRLDQQSPEVRAAKDQAETRNQLVARLDLDKQAADARVRESQARLTAIVGQRQSLESRIKRAESGIHLLTARLAELTNPLVQTVVNLPLIDFAASPYKVDQIVAEDHHVDVNFATVPRVDRCETCHQTIERKDPTPAELAWRAQHQIDAVQWSKQPQPLSNHPRLDLFVGDNSPHPASTYGCTVCHWGWDRETTFSRAGHTPDAEEKHPYRFDEPTGKWVRTVDPEGDREGEAPAEPMTAKTKPVAVRMTQRDAWEKNYHWREQEFLPQPMREMKYVQAGCLKCHTDQTTVTGAEKLDHGRRLIEQLGCWSCHKMKQLETYSTHRVEPGEDFDAICRSHDVSADEVRRLNNLEPDAAVKVGQDLTLPVRTLRKPGPSLYKIAAKTNREWTRKWLENPPAFRPNTYMPRFWGLINNRQTPERNAVEIAAITEFLFDVSDAPPYPAPPVAGDAARGKKRVGELGCLACHLIDERLIEIKPPANLAGYMDQWDYRRYRSQGPQLAGAGSKTAVNWLYAWLKNPKQYNPNTKMPNLRLSDQEAADVAAYLAGLRRAPTDAEPLPSVDERELDTEATEYLQVTLPREQAVAKLDHVDDLIEPYFADAETARYYQNPALLAQLESKLAALKKEYEDTMDDAVDRQAKALAARLDRARAGMKAARDHVASMSNQQKKTVYLGSRLISRYGCFACHDIRGFETAKPIGTELSVWGSKPLTQLDFGLIPIEHDRIAFLKQKMHEPRAFDTGRIDVTRSSQELLKMPKFNLNDEQIDQIVTVISGMTDEKLTPNEPRQLTPAEYQIERGRWMVKELNCVGCHIIEGKGGAIRATGVPAGMEPPLLSGKPSQLQQGQRTRPDWLFQFLKSPSTGKIRPWLKARMPTFQLSDAEDNVLVRYFALEARAQFPYQTPKTDVSPEHLAAGRQLFTQLKCSLCHIVDGRALGKPLEEIPEADLPRLAPDLTLAHERLQRDWLIGKWLPDPGLQVPGTRMPQFEYGPGLAPNVLGGNGRQQIDALADYVLSLGAPGTTAAPPAPAPSPGK